ncbi:hypothetical protein Tco_1198286 [Tanacetum coccineum]
MANDPNNVQGPPPVGPNLQNPNPDLRPMEELLQAPTDGVGDAIVVLHERPQGALPSNTEPNPREQVNLITTRSGLTTAKPSIPPPVPPTPRVEVEKEMETLMDEVHTTSPASTAYVPPPGIQPVSPPKPKEDPKPNPHQPKIPYPSRLNKTKLLDKNDVQASKFLKILKQLHFDISLMDALTQIPKYHKVLKYLLKDKEKLVELVDTPINAECSAILLNKVPEKLEDPGKFIIPCVLQDLKADPRVPIILGRPFLRTAKALVDLYEEKLTLRVGKEEVVFYTEKSSRNNSRDIQSVHCINIINFSKDKPISGSTTSHSNLSLPSYESFCFDHQEEKSSGSTTSHSNHSLPGYESFCFDVDHIEEKSSGSTTSHYELSLLEYESFHFDLLIDQLPLANRSDFYHTEFADELAPIISPPEYDHFYFDLVDDPGELTRILKENISETSTKDLTINEFNDFPLLLSDCDSTFSEEFSEIDLLVLFPSRNKDKIFNPGIFIVKGVQSQRFHILPLDDFSTISFVSDSLSLTDPSEIETFLSFPFKNKDKVFDLGILLIDGVLSFTRKSPHLLNDNFKIDKCHISS